MPQQRKGSVVAAFGWMLVLSIILGIFLPTIGPFIAGLVGGARAGSIKNALLAALVPAILTGLDEMIVSGGKPAHLESKRRDDEAEF
jgi:hypothetical protein